MTCTHTVTKIGPFLIVSHTDPVLIAGPGQAVSIHDLKGNWIATVPAEGAVSTIRLTMRELTGPDPYFGDREIMRMAEHAAGLSPEAVMETARSLWPNTAEEIG